jgi:preprotein translocase subunit SecF
MMFKRAINFIRLRWIFIGFSVFIILAGVVGYVVNGGFNLSIDFTSGLSEQFQINPAGAKATIGQVRAVLAPLQRFDLQVVGSPQEQQYLVRVQASNPDSQFQDRTTAQIHDLLATAYGADNLQVSSSDFVGPRYSGELATQTIWILLVAILGILIYAAIRFQFIYGAAAVLTTVHDALFMIGVTAIFRIEFTTTTVAALLTIIGYSINDTIVVFDRVRENRGLMRESDLGTILNTSITQTLTRTILTSLTTMMAILALIFLATGDIKNFATLMVVGIVEGTYSTIFVASPIVYMWTGARDRKRKARELAKFGRGMAAAPGAAPAAPAASRGSSAFQPAAEAEAVEGELGVEVADEEPEEVAEYPQAAGEQRRGFTPEEQAPAKPAFAPGGQPSQAPAGVPAGAGAGYVRLQRRHKKRKR